MPGSAFGRLLVAVLGVWSIACSTPPATTPSTPAGSLIPSSPPSREVREACAVPMPPAWQEAFAGGTTMPEGMRFGLGHPSVVGNVVYGQYNTASTSGIARLDLSTGQVEKLVSYAPDVSGTASIVVEPPWLAWTQGNSKHNVSDWSVHAMNLQTGESLKLSESRRRDGSFLPGQQPTLAVHGGMLAWSQALPGPLTQYQSEVHVFELDARKDTIIASGKVSAPVYAKDLMIWAERDGAGRYLFKASDANSLAPAEVPTALRDPGSIIFLSANKDWFAWTAEGLLELNIWRVGTDERRAFRAPDIKHYFQFMKFAGDYLLWYSGVTSVVLDLGSGAFFDVPGSVAGGPDLIVIEQPTVTNKEKGQFVASRVAAAKASALPRLACGR
jgi:hypothetical protein